MIVISILGYTAFIASGFFIFNKVFLYQDAKIVPFNIVKYFILNLL